MQKHLLQKGRGYMHKKVNQCLLLLLYLIIEPLIIIHSHGGSLICLELITKVTYVGFIPESLQNIKMFSSVGI